MNPWVSAACCRLVHLHPLVSVTMKYCGVGMLHVFVCRGCCMFLSARACRVGQWDLSMLGEVLCALVMLIYLPALP